MRIVHVALWTYNLEEAARFWSEYFGATIGPKYESARRKGFTSCFITIGDAPTIELMSGPWIKSAEAVDIERSGWAHVAVSVASEDAVRSLAARLETAGFLISPPRKTGDGFYEAVARTPDGARVEITA